MSFLNYNRGAGNGDPRNQAGSGMGFSYLNPGANSNGSSSAPGTSSTSTTDMNGNPYFGSPSAAAIAPMNSAFNPLGQGPSGLGGLAGTASNMLGGVGNTLGSGVGGLESMFGGGAPVGTPAPDGTASSVLNPGHNISQFGGVLGSASNLLGGLGNALTGNGGNGSGCCGNSGSPDNGADNGTPTSSMLGDSLAGTNNYNQAWRGQEK